MQKALLPTLLLILLFAVCAVGQKTFSSVTWGFSMQEPEGWQSLIKSDRVDNLSKTELPEDTRKQVLADNRADIFLVGYQKFEATKAGGLVPSIQVAIRKKSLSTLAEFKDQIDRSTKSLSTTFSDFKLLDESNIDVSGIKGIQMIFTFTSTRTSGLILRARTRAVMIPLKQYYFQIYFNDGLDLDSDCSSMFDSLLKTISIKP